MRRTDRTPSEFGRLLEEHLAAVGMSQVEFGQQAGVPAGTLTNLKFERHPRAPDPEDVRRWAKVLGLTGEEAERFVLEAMLACSPAYVREAFRRLLQQG